MKLDKNALTFSYGDGGSLNQRIARLPGIPSVKSNPHIFRQWGADGPEWHTQVTLSWRNGSATYRTVRTFNSGHDYSFLAQRTLQRMSNVYLQYSQSKDCYNSLLVCVLVDIAHLGHWTDLAVLLLENRLTFLYPYVAPVWEYLNLRKLERDFFWGFRVQGRALVVVQGVKSLDAPAYLPYTVPKRCPQNHFLGTFYQCAAYKL